MSNSKNSTAALFATLTKEHQDLVVRLIHLLLNDAAFEKRIHELESEKGGPLTAEEIILFMYSWTGDLPSSEGKEAV